MGKYKTDRPKSLKRPEENEEMKKKKKKFYTKRDYFKGMKEKVMF